MTDDQQARLEQAAPREWKIYGVICAEKGSAAYNAAPSKYIQVIEKSAYDKLKADEAKRVAGLAEALIKLSDYFPSTKASWTYFVVPLRSR